ncbi:MAG: PAS domain-containing protein, partial [Burkholderiales bacterium]
MHSDHPPVSTPSRADPLDAQALASVLRSLPGTAVLVLALDAPRFTILDATDDYLSATLKQRNELVGHSLFEVLPDANPANPAPSGVESLRASLERVLATGEADRMPVTRYDVVGAGGGSWHERYWAPHNVPARGPDGRIRALIHHVRDVTAEVLGGKAVQAAERRATATLQRMADAYTLLDRDFRMVAVNAATEKALGRSRGELLGRSHWEVFPASFDSALGRAYRRVVSEGVEQHLTQHYAGDGIDKHLEIDAYPTDDGGVAIFWRDTTEQHTARERLEMAVSIAKLGLFEWHLPSGAVRIDARARELFAFGPDEPVSAAQMFARMHPEDAGRVRELTLESVRLGKPVDVEYRLLLPDGSVRYISSAGQMVGGLHGDTVQVFGVFADISDRVLADQALRNSEVRFRTIANAMPQMLWSTLANGFHDYYNDRWYEYTGVPQGSTDGDGWNDVFHPDDQPRAWQRWQHSLATGEPYEIEYRLRHRSGEYRWVLGRALPIRDDAGRIVRWMGTCTDVPDQKTARDELANQNRRKDEFLAMLAHELRNPLAPITAAAYLLTAPGNDAARVKRSAEIISRQAQHLTS